MSARRSSELGTGLAVEPTSQAPEPLSRRTLLQGALAFSFVVGGVTELLAPRAARARNADLKVLTKPEANTLEAFCEALVPGASEAGIVHFVDHQLSLAPADALLLLRYLDVHPPYADFYRAGLAALDAICRAAHGSELAGLHPKALESLIGSIAADNPAGWSGPPAPLFYFALRSDAVDVVYGTPEGFARLGVPYMPHINPQRPW